MFSPSAMIVCALMLSACVSVPRYESMRHRAEAAEAETQKALTFLAGQQEDNAMLQRGMIEQEMALRSLQGGMIIQAAETAKMREACDL